MPKLLIALVLSTTLLGISGCGNSECREVNELEAPAYETLIESEKWLTYWETQARIEKEGKTRVCRDTFRLNKKTLKVEKTGEVCFDETGVNSGDTLKALQNAQSRYEDSLYKWSRIIKLYPDCFGPEKVIRANS